MDLQAAEKRKRIMGRSIKLGHCVCSPDKPCPCPEFKEKNICECAGEREQIIDGEIRLTDHVRAVGCASKVPKKYLHEVLSGLHGFKDNRVIVGNESSDDAGVIQISGNENASIMTVDVFAPSVDDPYTFGMIAAANSLSDIYAMGARAESALSIVGFPIYSLPESAMSAMLQGGADKLAEAEVAVIGGHSINDSEVKCGYAILGSIAQNRAVTNSGAEVGDLLVITKPIGGGIILFGKQVEKASASETDEVTAAMTTLNKIAGENLNRFNAHAATDVTGFSLLGHLAEIASGSNVEIELDFSKVPLFSGVKRLARADVFPGAVERNREAAGSEIINYHDLTQAEQNILYSPETSGGLLLSLTPTDAAEYISFLAEHNINGVIIGKVTGKADNGKINLCGTESVGATIPNSNINNFTATAAKNTAAPCCNSTGPATPTSCCTPSGTEEPSSCCSSPEPAAPACCCSNGNNDSESKELLPPPAANREFGSYSQALTKEAALTAKTKKLIAIALSVSHKCAECTRVNTTEARRLGASSDEIAEAVGLGISFGGVTSNVFYNELRNSNH